MWTAARTAGCRGPRYQDLILILDDADSEVYYAQLVPEESMETVMAAIREVVEQESVFSSRYTDAASHFVHTPVAGYPPDREHHAPQGVKSCHRRKKASGRV